MQQFWVSQSLSIAQWGDAIGRVAFDVSGFDNTKKS
jgi:hypothetical protein